MMLGSGRSNEAAVTIVGVDRANAGAYHDRLCRSAARSCQTGHDPLGLKRSEQTSLTALVVRG
jgi:hypothetical protein